MSFLVFFLSFSLNLFAYEKHELAWPLPIRKDARKFGPLVHQYQKFPGSLAYFHEGVDIQGEAGQAVYSPVSGFIDGGYYSYTIDERGKSFKDFISLKDIPKEDKEPKLWGENYFEISVTDAKGYRFEFHHIDRDKLPKNILEAIYKGDYIFEGSEVGKVLAWPRQVYGKDYHHIHYGVFTAEGEVVNSFWLSSKVKDLEAPKIYQHYFQLKAPCPETGRVDHLFTSTLKEGDKPTHIILKAKDQLGNNFFSQAPVSLKAFFSDGSLFSYDFSYSLNFQGVYPDLREIYLPMLCLGTPEEYFVLPASTNFDFFLKIPLPSGFRGNVDIRVFDFNGNQAQKMIEIF